MNYKDWESQSPSTWAKVLINSPGGLVTDRVQGQRSVEETVSNVGECIR